jgi:hypothetical protein
MNRLTIKNGTLSHTLPFTVRFRGEGIPEGKVTLSANEGWSVEPKELDLRSLVLSRRGEGVLTVSGPTVFKEEPVVTMTATTKDGASKQSSRHVAMTYAYYAKQGPTLDGKLDDPCWKKARQVTQFHPEGSAGPAPYPTPFKVCYDDTHIYVAVEAKGIDPEKMVAKPPDPKGKEAGLWGQECMEIFFDPTQRAGKIPYQLVMNYLGRKQDMLGEDTRWNGQWEVKGAKGKEGYIIELAVPYTTLRTQKPKPHDIWAFNVYRNTFRPFRGFHGCWSVVGDTRASNFFGRLYFLE